jgi:hypothetical protein
MFGLGDRELLTRHLANWLVAAKRAVKVGQN